MSTSSKPSPSPEPVSKSMRGSVQDCETLLVDELCRRYGLKRHSRRQLRTLGLKIVRLGSKDFTTGEWFRDLIEKLAAEQANP